MSSIVTAWSALRSRAEANITLPMYWPDENIELPDTPASFVYFFMENFRAFLAGFGGGAGNNLWRNPAELHAFAFVPVGQGVAVAMTHAETVAALFRSFRSSDVSCFAASVHPVGKGAEIIPAGLDPAAGNYAAAVAIIDLHFDQIG